MTSIGSRAVTYAMRRGLPGEVWLNDQCRTFLTGRNEKLQTSFPVKILSDGVQSIIAALSEKIRQETLLPF